VQKVKPPFMKGKRTSEVSEKKSANKVHQEASKKATTQTVRRKFVGKKGAGSPRVGKGGER